MMSGNEDSKFNAWPLIRNDWRESIQGQAAVSNILYYNLFKSALSCLASQDKGVYLQENQGWEFGLIRAWREAGHGEIIGAPHATIKFWDLRRFFDPRNYQQKGGNVLPLPDYVALNGEMAKERYLEGGYPAECLVECEALRYLYLESEVRQKREVKKLGMPLKFLVLGDFLSENTVWQLKLLEEFCISSRANIDIFVRPHPACPIEVQDYPGIDMEMTNMALSELLKVCDVAYTSSTTSAAVDAYSAGIDVISVLNPNSLNLSPLRGLNGVSFVSSPEELAEAIKCQSAERVGLNEYSEYFFLDADLTRWISLICDSDYSNRLKLRYINE